MRVLWGSLRPPATSVSATLETHWQPGRTSQVDAMAAVRPLRSANATRAVTGLDPVSSQEFSSGSNACKSQVSHVESQGTPMSRRWIPTVSEDELGFGLLGFLFLE